MKADDKVEFEDEEGKKKAEKYSHFEYLEKKVEVLQEELDLVTSILRQNNLVLKEEQTAGMTDITDETYKRLEDDDE